MSKIILTDDQGNAQDVALPANISVTVTPPAPVSPPPPPPSNTTHTVIAQVTDAAGYTWNASAEVGNDPTAPMQFVKLTDAAGNVHPGLRAFFFVDGCKVGATNPANGNDFGGTLTVSYDGQPVFGPQAVQFPRGCVNATIRYGVQAAWKAPDPTLFPNWAIPAKPLPLWPLAKYDLTYNGMGVATMPGMSSAGARPDIGYVPEWDALFAVAPSDDTFAPVRAAADHCGGWAIYFADDATGQPIDITAYPMTCLLSWHRAQYKGNPIVAYTGTVAATKPNAISNTAFMFSATHETGYGFMAAAATGSAHDAWVSAFWANAQLIAIQPIALTPTRGIWGGADERMVAWTLRSLFLGAHLSSVPAYFAAQLAAQLPLAPMTNPLGFVACYLHAGATGPKSTLPPWQEYYIKTSLNTIALKQDEWKPVAACYFQGTANMMQGNLYPLATMYEYCVTDASGTPFTTAAEVLEASLNDPQGDVPAKTPFTAAQIAELLSPDVTLQQVHDIWLSGYPHWNGKVGDFVQPFDVSAPYNYPAWLRASVAAAVDLGIEGATQAWATIQAVPTPVNYTAGWKLNIVPRA